MFCDQCGTQLQTGQPSCTRCGKAVLVQIAYRRNRVQEHVRLVGILWMAYSALVLLGAVALMIVAHTVFGETGLRSGPPPEVSHWLRPLLSFIAFLVMVKGVAGFAAGWGLLQREPWARAGALVVGFISLFNVPIGTALG